MESRLRALYYPFSRCLDAEALKRAVLYFDEVWFLDPLTADQRDSALSAAPRKSTGYTVRMVHERWPSIRDDYAYLAEEGIARFVDPRPLLVRWDKLFLAALRSDLSDDAFVRLSFGAGPMVWDMLRAKMPPSIFHLLDPRGMTFDEAVGGLELLYTDHPHEVFRIAKPFGEYGKYVAQGLITGDGEAYSLSYPQGVSLGLTHALLLAEQESVSLLTDNDVHYSLMLNRFQRAMKHPETQTVRRIIAHATPEELLKQQLVATNLIDTVLPELRLSELTVQDCVRFRKEARDALGRFRTLVAELSAEIERSPWDPEFDVAIRKVVASRVLPELQKLEDDLAGVYQSLGGRLLKKAAGGLVGGGSSFAASILAGLSPFALLTLSCTALAASMGVTAVELIESLLQQKRIACNTIHYLLQLKELQ